MGASDPRPTEIIASRLRVPAARTEFTVRSRLLEQLIGVTSPIVKIEAPAAFGKSTLLQQWATSEHRPVAFVRLGWAESDPVVFWRCVVAALKTVDPDLVRAAQQELAGAHLRQIGGVAGPTALRDPHRGIAFCGGQRRGQAPGNWPVNAWEVEPTLGFGTRTCCLRIARQWVQRCALSSTTIVLAGVVVHQRTSMTVTDHRRGGHRSGQGLTCPTIASSTTRPWAAS